jgi:peptidoglycan hydrolase-like protein with peptidoglycan-binding domain
MGKLLLTVISPLVGLLMLALSPDAAWAQRRVALVIGNSGYQHAPRLENPVRDATSIGELFTRVGFDVVDVRRDLGVRELKRVLREFLVTTRDADIAVVYYAGHGIEISGVNYLIPIDARLASDYDAEDEAVDLDRIVRTLEPARRLRLVLLDACRDNPFGKKMQRAIALRAMGNGLAKVEPTSTDTLIAYAAKAGSTAEDGSTDHSPFATALLRNLGEPGLDIRIALGRVRDDVLRLTANRQEPFVYGSLGGSEIPLVPRAPEPRRIEVVAIDPNADARRDYEAAERVGTVGGWKSFLTLHPDGYYGGLAQEQLKKLLGPGELEAERVWARLRDSGDVAAMRDFIARFPTSPLAAYAQNRISLLERAAAERQQAEAARKGQELLAKAEAERQQAEAERRERERQERERIARAEAERREQERVAKAEAERVERERLAKAEAERIERERLAKAEAERKEQERIAKAEAERKERERLAKAEAERKEQERIAKAEAERLERERVAKTEAERKERERVAKAEAERKEQERAAKAEADRLERERVAKTEAERKEQERIAKAQAERLERERAAKAEAERKEQERIAKAETERERIAKAEADRKERERVAKAEVERKEQERVAKAEAERVERERVAKVEAERKEQERVAKAEAERVERERVAKVEAERLDRERIAKADIAAPQTAPSPQPSSAVPSPAAASPQLVATAQIELTRLGCYSGRPNGVLDETTQKAIETYLSKRGQPAEVAAVTETLVSDLKHQAAVEGCVAAPAKGSPAVAKRDEASEPEAGRKRGKTVLRKLDKPEAEPRRERRPAPAVARQERAPQSQPQAQPKPSPSVITTGMGM